MLNSEKQRLITKSKEREREREPNANHKPVFPQETYLKNKKRRMQTTIVALLLWTIAGILPKACLNSTWFYFDSSGLTVCSPEEITRTFHLKSAVYTIFIHFSNPWFSTYSKLHQVILYFYPVLYRKNRPKGAVVRLLVPDPGKQLSPRHPRRGLVLGHGKSARLSMGLRELLGSFSVVPHSWEKVLKSVQSNPKSYKLGNWKLKNDQVIALQPPQKKVL